jgi:hypothetical protein
MKRRDLIKNAGIAVSGSAILGTAAAKKPEEITVRRNFGDSLSVSELVQKRDQIIKNWKRNNRTRRKRYSVWTPNVPDELSIVAFDFKMSDDGVPLQKIGYTNKSVGVEEVQDSVTHANYRRTDSHSVSTQTVTTQSGEDWSTWNTLSSDQSHYSYYDGSGNLEGVLTQEYEHKVDPDDGSTDYNWHAVQTGSDMEAGTNRDSSNPWENSYSTIYHHWSNADSELNIDMQDRKPRGTTSGTVTTSYTLDSSGPSVSFSYSQPTVDVTDGSSMSINEGEWSMDITAGSDPAKTNAYFEPASIAQLTPPGYCRSGGWTIGTFDITCEFRDSSFGGSHSHDAPNYSLGLGC